MKNRKSVIRPIFLLLVAIALAVPVVVTVAQEEPTDGEYTITEQQIDSGSGEMDDGEYAVYGTAGVPYGAAEPMTDGEYTLEPAVLTPQPPANAYIHLSALAFLFGDSWQGVSKQPIADLYVEVYDETCVEVANYGNWSWNCNLRKDYFDTVRATCDPVNTEVTDVDGEATIDVYSVPGPHVIIALYETEIDGEVYQLYLAKRVQIDELGGTTDVKLGVMVYTSRFTAKKRVLPLMGTTVYGSELDVYEPEYIVWEEGLLQEDFPFVSVSAETWTIDTSLYPPEGYVPDEETKTTIVEGTTETTVFEVTEVGSVMDYTRIEHDIKEIRDGKVVQRVHLKHGIGTKSHGRPEKFAPISKKLERKGEPTPHGQPESITIHEIVTGNQPADSAGNAEGEGSQESN